MQTSVPGAGLSTIPLDHQCFYRTLIEESLDVITGVDVAGTIIFTNPSSERLLGYAPSEILGRSVFELMHAADADIARAAFGAAVHTGQPSPPLELRYRCKDGSWRTLEAVGRYSRSGEGDPFGIINSRDVTDRKLLERRIRQAQKLEAIGLMTGAIAHDYNNLLVVLTAYAQIFEAEASPSVRADAAIMRTAIDHAKTLTDQLLGFVRRDDDEQPVSVDVHAAIAGLNVILERLAGRLIDLGFSLDAPAFHVRITPGSLEQLLLNLVVNACDAMPTGGTLKIATRTGLRRRGADVSSPGRLVEHVIIEVHDSGTGVSPDVRAQMFDPFFTTKAPGAGSGLGLYTVRGIVQRAGGSIDVETEVGRGTTVRVMLPVYEE